MTSRADTPRERAFAKKTAAGGASVLPWIDSALALVFAVYGASWVVAHAMPINAFALRTFAITDQSDATADRWFITAIFGSILLLGLLGLLLFRQRPRAGRIGRVTAIAFLSGVLAVAILIGIACVSGIGTLAAKPFPHPRAGLFLTGSVLVLLQVCSEEFLFRGVVQPVLTRAAGWLIAVLVSALGFTAVHYFGGDWMNPVSLFNIFLAGVWFGLLAQRTGGLIAPIMAHFAYNWTEEMLFGASPNPGVGSFGSLVDIDLSGAAIWGGSAEGLNASIVLTLVLVLLIAALLRRPPARSMNANQEAVAPA